MEVYTPAGKAIFHVVEPEDKRLGDRGHLREEGGLPHEVGHVHVHRRGAFYVVHGTVGGAALRCADSGLLPRGSRWR